MTRIAIIAVAVVAGLGVLWGIYNGIWNAGYRAAQAICKEATIKTELEAKKRDLNAEQNARQEAEIAATELSDRAKAREAKVRELEDQLQKNQKPGDTCVWREPRAPGGVRRPAPAAGGHGSGQPGSPGRPGLAPPGPAARAS